MRKIIMGMSIQEFAKHMEHIGNIYGNKFVVNRRNDSDSNDKTIESWYKYFKDYDSDVLEQVIEDWVINNASAPTIADLKSPMNRGQIHKYHELEKEDGVSRGTYINSQDWIKQ